MLKIVAVPTGKEQSYLLYRDRQPLLLITDKEANAIAKHILEDPNQNRPSVQPPPENATIGKLFRNARQKKSHTQDECAEFLGIHRNTIHRLENEPNKINLRLSTYRTVITYINGA